MHFVLKQRSILYSLRNFTYVHKLHIRNGFKAHNEMSKVYFPSIKIFNSFTL